MGEIGSVLFVCTGNLCRSPMAEGILKNLLEKRMERGIKVASAGTWGVAGNAAAPYATEVCKENGIDISGHEARELTEEMVRESDLVVVMEFDHLHTVLDMVPNAAGKIRMLTQFGGEERNFYHSIPDPYGRPKREYERCYRQIEKHVRFLLDDIKQPDGKETE